MYSFNYNSVGLGALAVCFAEMVAWRTQGRPVQVGFWAAAISVELLAYPPLAMGIGIVLAARLLAERDVRTMRQAAIWLTASVVALGVVAYRFGITPNLLTAVEFSRAFNVGIVLRLGLRGLVGLAAVTLIWLAMTQREPPEIVKREDGRLTPLVAAALALLGAIACYRVYVSADDEYLAAVCGFAAALVGTAWPAPGNRRARFWVTALFLVSGAAVAGASSRGSHQAQGPALLAASILFGAGVSHLSRQSLRIKRVAAWTAGAVVLTIHVVYFLANPYQDGRVWRQTARLDESAAMRYLWVTPEKAAAVHAARDLFSDIPRASSVMVVGAHPWIYFATDTRPDTDMVFMHSAGAPRAFDLLAGRLRLRRPEYILRVAEVVPAVDTAIDELVRAGDYVCDQRRIGPALMDARNRIQTFYDVLPVVTVCRRPDVQRRIAP
jgi:hypothetical protein